jgi:HK97 family phage major capsid protein
MLIELNKRKNEILDAQSAMIKNALDLKINLTSEQNSAYDKMTNEVNDLNRDIKRVEALNQGRSEIGVPREGVVTPAISNGPGSRFVALSNRGPRYANTVLPSVSADYRNKFWASMKSSADFNRFLIQNASVIGEGGSSGLGGALVPVETSPDIPALAIPESAVRKLVNVQTTSMDINLPFQASLGVAALTPESNSTGINMFQQNPPTFGTTQLGAFQIGGVTLASWSVLSDVRFAETFLTREIGRAIQTAEEILFISGTGTNEPQGLLGQGLTAAGESITGGAAALSINALFDTESTLNSSWYTNAKWLMHRQTFNNLAKQQLAANIFNVYQTYTPGGGGTILGYPVAFSAQMPVFGASPATTGAIIFSSFEDFAILGDRGGPDVMIKILDQPFATSGQTAILGFRRSDLRVVLPQAAVQLNING